MCKKTCDGDPRRHLKREPLFPLGEVYFEEPDWSRMCLAYHWSMIGLDVSGRESTATTNIVAISI